MGTTEHSRISKREFISRAAARSGLSIKDVNEAYKALFGELTDAVKGGETVMLTGFGRFYRQARKGHKVRFGKNDVDDYSVLKFSASRSVNRGLELDKTADPTKGTVKMNQELEAVS
ncbi:HU family DNA-binding protein [Streptomyces sp. NPDC007083]|uniref:HU family DNA-binding protein n=1 Tax=Streptomyces sp. NPDC007083 TaxID=3156913 RepID=UPI0033C60EBB